MAFAPLIGPGGWALLPAHLDEDGRRGLARDRRELLARYPNRLSRVPRNLRMAIQVAREQEGEDVGTARGDLARLCAEQSKRQKAYDVLAPLYGWFTERFDIADLEEANAQLGELQ